MTTARSSWTVAQLARRVAEAVLAEHLRHHEPMDAWELARVVGEHADRVGRQDLGCESDSHEVKVAADAIKVLAEELVAYCEFGPNPTPDAYAKACQALDRWRERARRAEAELARLAAAPAAQQCPDFPDCREERYVSDLLSSVKAEETVGKWVSGCSACDALAKEAAR